jgi:hypothetical protein
MQTYLQATLINSYGASKISFDAQVTGEWGRAINNFSVDFETEQLLKLPPELFVTVVPSIQNVEIIEKVGVVKVFWMDGDMTMSRASNGDVFSPEGGLAIAILKKFYGSYTPLQDLMDNADSPEKRAKQKAEKKAKEKAEKQASSERLREQQERLKRHKERDLEESIKFEAEVMHRAMAKKNGMAEELEAANAMILKQKQELEKLQEQKKEAKPEKPKKKSK